MHCLALGLSLCYFQRFTFSVFLITRDCWLRYRPHPTLRDCVKCAPVWTARSWSTQVIREGLYRLWLADQYTLTLSHTHTHTHTLTHTQTRTHTCTQCACEYKCSTMLTHTPWLPVQCLVINSENMNRSLITRDTQKRGIQTKINTASKRFYT